jgi:uncharacterized membrane protein YphA (DoxX/SURF4 family)
MQYLVFHLLRISLGIVFLLSGIVKARGVEEFAYTVRLVMQSWFAMVDTHIPLSVPALWSGLAITLILAELGIGAALLLNRATKYIAAFSTLMLTVFTGALLVLMQFGHSCGCFGTSDGVVSGAELLRNALLIGCSIVIWLIASQTKKQQSNTNDVQVLNARAGDLR